MSLSDKTNLEVIVSYLVKKNVKIISTGGTFKAIKNITDEVLEVVRSIPLDPDDLVRQIELELKDDFVLTLRYKPTSCEAQFEYRKGRRIKTKRINWTTHKEQEKPQA